MTDGTISQPALLSLVMGFTLQPLYNRGLWHTGHSPANQAGFPL